MSHKTYIPDGEQVPASQIGATIDALAATLSQRHNAGDESSYSYRLISGKLDDPLKKLMEEAGEVALAAKDVELASGSVDHLRYEAGDVVYHLLVILERFGISVDELAAELNMRMRDDERPQGGVLLHASDIERGK